ncbi:helix-turn-helix transcriptional regulator [Shimia sp.]|uniref:helix-turn-helix domain-containing protein n=1 Tax=Shimia sp. TaxID=1954381 RepID=UPI003297A19A
MAGAVRTRAYQDLLKALVLARQDAGLSQAQLAERLGKPASFVGKYELGERRLDVVELVVVLKVIGVSVKDVLGAVEGAAPEKL